MTGFIGNTIDFLIAVALGLLAWLAFLLANDRLSRLKIPVLKEILGALLGIGLFVSLATILYFFSLPLAMGVLAIMFLVFLAYAAIRTKRLMRIRHESE